MVLGRWGFPATRTCWSSSAAATVRSPSTVLMTLGDLGQEVSNGCVRMANEAITALANSLPLGAPVTIRP
jgi:hypothetical protein